MPGTRTRTATKATKFHAAPIPTKRKATRSAPVPEPDLLSPTSTAHSLTPPPPSSPAKRRKLSSEFDFFASPPTQRPPVSSRFRHTIKPIDQELMVFDHVAAIKEIIRGGRSMSPVGHVPLNGPSSSITLVGEDEDEEGEEELFEPTTLPWNMRDLDTHPALLIKFQRNWFPAYLTGFQPVISKAEKKAAKKKDIWQVLAHPATGLSGVRSLKKESIMYLDDERLGDCVLGKVTSQERQFLSDARTRAMSPIPTLENPHPLPPPNDFNLLDRIEQFRLLRPHLSDIVHERYAPAQSRIDRFYSELVGRKKSSLIRNIRYGDISEDEAVNVFIPELERWALRGCRPESDEPDPPEGSSRYDSLTVPQKRQYVQLILQPEIIIRICLASYETEDLLRHPIATPDPSASDLYKVAQEKLGNLAKESPEELWARIINEIQMARAGHRRRKGLPEENLSAYDKEQALLHGGEMTIGWAGGRIRKAREYYQGDGKQRDPRRPKEGV